MSKRVYVDSERTKDGKYRVLQEDSETEQQFGVKDFDSEEEARKFAEEMQQAIDNADAEKEEI